MVEYRRVQHVKNPSSHIGRRIPTRNFDSSQAAFEEMRKKDPYRLTSLDTYSNILFVKEFERQPGSWQNLPMGVQVEIVANTKTIPEIG